MILARATRAIRDQNWFAVGLDFVIVVAGVLFALQLSIWAEARSEQAELNALLVEFRSDLEENRVQILAHLDELRGVQSSVETMRTALAGDLSEIDEDAFQAAFMLTVRVPFFDLTLDAREAMSSSDWRTLIDDRSLVEQITRWDLQLALVDRLHRDALNHRDGTLMGLWITGPASLAGALHQSRPIAEAGLSRSRFSTDFATLSQSRTFDDSLALRFGIATQQAHEAQILLQYTDELVDQLDGWESER